MNIGGLDVGRWSKYRTGRRSCSRRVVESVRVRIWIGSRVSEKASRPLDDAGASGSEGADQTT